MTTEHSSAPNPNSSTNHDTQAPDVLPILTVEGFVVYPFTTARMVVPPKHKAMVRDANEANGLIGIVTKPTSEDGQRQINLTGLIATMVRVKDVDAMPDGNDLLNVEGVRRIRILQTITTGDYTTARIEPAGETIQDDIEAEALRRRLIEQALEVIELSPQIPEAVGDIIRRISSPLKIAYLLASNVKMDLNQRMAMLSLDNVEEKMKLLMEKLNKELEILRFNKSIDDKVQDSMSSQQREYHLRQKLAAIQKELGEDEATTSEIDAYRAKIEASAMSVEAKEEAEREFKRLSRLSPQSAEYPVIQTYLNWLLDLPWERPKNERIDIIKAQSMLDEHHFGLEPVKERIIEYLAAHQLSRDRQGEIEDDAVLRASRGIILCLAGPPGTGKTSLGKSIASAMQRSFTRMSLGGIRDESEIRGHRRTYVGAMPGRIIQAIKRAGTRNPVFILDEVDKIGQDWRGDPSSALLEVLDPEQNVAFRDHYLDVDFDLSDVVFIATANQLDTIPAPLRDRMDIISLDGYTEHEKFQIAKKHLIPRQMSGHGLLENEVTFMDEAIHKIIEYYTREAGVRSLERHIITICRKSIVQLHQNQWHSLAITSEQVKDFLKKEKFEHDRAEVTAMAGIATGLAVTAAGGEILHIEATRMPGKGRLTLTGQLGDVMKESAQIAHSYVRSRAHALGIEPEAFETSDIHLHIPAGALPKDGPSAGLVMTLAMASVYTGKIIPGSIGVTGEITLRGRVLPVGGIKMKVLAAHRAGLTHLFLPRRNRRDMDEVPSEVRTALQINWVDTIDDAIAQVFPKPSAAFESSAAAHRCRDQSCPSQAVSVQ